MRIAVAMSGGVDSSVAAALLKEQGHEVIGLTMQLMPKVESRCCGLEAIEDARKVARRLDIPHYIIDFRNVFEREVIADFCREYGRGRTPNPCVLCNNILKFGLLWEKAAALDAAFIATGHYARIEPDAATGRYRLKKGADKKKDQSYFLCRLTQAQLGHTLFPVGGMTKEAVRQKAAALGLPVAARPESQEICFVPDDDLAGFLAERLPMTAGPILDTHGRKLGEHRGLARYTVGQRHGLGIAAAAPLFVTALLPDTNTLVVGTKAEAFSDSLTAGEIVWTSGQKPELPQTYQAKIRYRHPGAKAEVVCADDDTVYVKFASPQIAIAPGQTIAFYEGENVAGGGVILRQGK